MLHPIGQKPNSKFPPCLTQNSQREETPLIATVNKIALSTRIPLPPEPAGPIQQMTASSPAILMNRHPDSINESGVTSTRCYPNRQECRAANAIQNETSEFGYLQALLEIQKIFNLFPSLLSEMEKSHKFTNPADKLNCLLKGVCSSFTTLTVND
ncbi:hypothetical protein TNIN_458351 [Trichonephila inaurata madagascariensis]|uniref:Uncharacterized protein n=1 Tax=Trichonephila inaurata madagascariensis TaxID=2747483 RepID=A0A8X6WMU1_9ARAC|nr:hypothetical protein TNIN_458351 [Trichonephila inaurata madagascariensis]